MALTNKMPQSRLSVDVRRLLELTEALTLSGSRLEDLYWEEQLKQLIAKLYKGRKNRHVETALDQLIPNQMQAYEVLVELAETFSESAEIQHTVDYEVLLVSAPVLIWTRYQLPLPAPFRDKDFKLIETAFRDHIAAPQAHVALLPQAISFEQMPQSFQDTARLTQQLGKQAVTGEVKTIDIAPLAHTEGMLADARFIIAAIAVPKGEPVFRWQTPSTPAAQMRAQSLQSWQLTIEPCFNRLFAGCTIDYQQPEAFFVSSREADRRIRPMALKAAAIWLQNAANLNGADIRATIIGCGDSIIEEYRVGFTTRQSNQVIYGCVWPILSKEEANLNNEGMPDIPDHIAEQLAEAGIKEVKRLNVMAHGEICDDCGAPFFPNTLGEMMHPELPEEIDLEPRHFH